MLFWFLCFYSFMFAHAFLWLDDRVDYRGLLRWRAFAVGGLVALAALLWPVLWLLVARARLRGRGRRRAPHP